ncbi:unnamed protein product [Victoria cruziana]
MIELINLLFRPFAFHGRMEQKGDGPGARSSHAVAVVGRKAYVFGGEFEPRVPIDNNTYAFDLDQSAWSIVPASGDIPPPRVGVMMAAVNHTIYVFGGRDADHSELNELYSFDTMTNQWKLLSSGQTGPEHRSYHSMTADDQSVYVFGGCGVRGRLNDLWSYDTKYGRWISYPAPGNACKPRGGPGLAVCGGKVWVVYGFSGVELDDVHCFDPVTGEWKQVESRGDKPSARSVFAAVGIGKYVVIYGGEVDPSDQGHLGAGRFSDEAYALDTETLVWTKFEDKGHGEHPGPRGWCAFSVAGGEGMMVYGGNSPSNDRLGDIFVFTPLL